MKELFATGLLLAAASLAPAAGEMSAQPADDGSVIAVMAIDAVAVVIEADMTRRTVTIRDPRGEEVTISIPPQLPLDQIQLGALLDLRYVEAEALTIAKPDAPATDPVKSVTIALKIGARAALTAKPRRVTGRIRDIDRRRRALTLVGPGDRPIALNVSPAVAGFEELKVGDTAVIEYLEPIVLSAVRHDGDRADSTRL